MSAAPRLYEIISRMQDEDHDLFEDIPDKQKKSFMEVIGRLQDDVYQDQLTGAQNRRSFDENVKDKNNFQFSMISIDLDKFKSVNDTYGHAAGDQILKDACKLINNVLRRKHDTVLYRLGGEELAVVLPNTSEEGAEVVAENIRKTLEKNLKIEGAERYVTASLGVGFYNGQESLDDFLEEVDGALYEAKETGRNKVVKLEDYKKK